MGEISWLQVGTSALSSSKTATSSFWISEKALHRSEALLMRAEKGRPEIWSVRPCSLCFTQMLGESPLRGERRVSSSNSNGETRSQRPPCPVLRDGFSTFVQNTGVMAKKRRNDGHDKAQQEVFISYNFIIVGRGYVGYFRTLQWRFGDPSLVHECGYLAPKSI